LSDPANYTILPRIDSPEDLKQLDLSELKILAEELRRFIVETVSRTGGHLGSNLGSVELTLALHFVYDAPRDQIVWDVGAQAYSHKIITGRRELFHTNRQYGGIAGFPRRIESCYDSFGVGHSSTSISAALGMAIARDLNGKKFKTVAVIGDGGMTGGMAFEGLNNAGAVKTDIQVVFNDNRMAISPNVGALHNLFNLIRSDMRFEKVKDNMWELIGRLPQGKRLRRAFRGMGDGVKTVFQAGQWFERLGFRYIGPIDGHDMQELIEVFHWLRELKGPIVVHVLTEKGKGYPMAESDPTHLHGVSKFNPAVGPCQKKGELKYCEHFSDELLKLARQDSRICAITPAMLEGSALLEFQKELPDRTFDVGIAEQHALTFAAGLATQGLRPVVAIYSTFLQRAYDQVVHDVALQELPVVMGVDRAGLVGEDGPTHHGSFDISYLRPIPNMVILAPRDGEQTRLMLRAALKQNKLPVAIRFPRGVPPIFPPPEVHNPNVLEPEFLKNGDRGVIISMGPALANCLRAAYELEDERRWNLAVLDIRCIKPLNQPFFHQLAADFKRWLVVEENALAGGAGSMLVEFLSDHDLLVKVKRLGLPDYFVSHGDRDSLWREVGLDAESIKSEAQAFFARQRQMASAAVSA